MTPELHKEHLWLQQLVGEWQWQSEATMGPGQPPIKSAGTESVRSLGGVWVLCDGSGEMPDHGLMRSLMTIGFDPARGRFVGAFVASAMTHLWIYDGARDGDVLSLDADGPSFTDPSKVSKYRDVIEIVDAGRKTLTASVLGDDGVWHRFMTAEYSRVS